MYLDKYKRWEMVFVPVAIVIINYKVTNKTDVITITTWTVGWNFLKGKT